MSFILAVMSIRADYSGALSCFTVVFTPIGTTIGITLTAVVNKNKKENTVGGVNYMKCEKSESTI